MGQVYILEAGIASPMDRFDQQHMLELVNHYWPGLPLKRSAEPAESSSTRSSPPPSALKIPDAQSSELTRRLTAWFDQVINSNSSRAHSRYGAIPSLPMSGECKDLKDIGNSRVPLYERVAFFLNSFRTLPTHPSFFHPNPKANARDIRNPYMATLATAYDFLEAISSQQIEYYLFLNRVLRCQRTNYSLVSSHHLEFAPLWVSFITFNDHKPEKPDEDRIYKCKTPGCKKQYRQLSGLQYHNTKGGCGLSLKDYGKPKNKSAKNPFSCPFVPCRKSFSCTNGLNFHISKYHLKKWHFNQGETFTYDYSCPACPFTSTLGDQLRSHILNIHPNPFHLRVG